MAGRGAKERERGVYKKVCHYMTPHFELLSNKVMPSAVAFHRLTLRPPSTAMICPVM